LVSEERVAGVGCHDVVTAALVRGTRNH
jgi:hypothetical protein